MGIILAIDSGTTSTRVIAFDSNFKIQHIEQAELPLIHSLNGWSKIQTPFGNEPNTALMETIKTVGTHNIRLLALRTKKTSLAWQKALTKRWGQPLTGNADELQTAAKELDSHAASIKQKTGLPLDAYFQPQI